MKLRQGRRVGRTLYEQQGPEPSATDPIIGMVDTPELAEEIVTAVNTRHEHKAAVTNPDMSVGPAPPDAGPALR